MQPYRSTTTALTALPPPPPPPPPNNWLAYWRSRGCKHILPPTKPTVRWTHHRSYRVMPYQIYAEEKAVVLGGLRCVLQSEQHDLDFSGNFFCPECLCWVEVSRCMSWSGLTEEDNPRSYIESALSKHIELTLRVGWRTQVRTEGRFSRADTPAKPERVLGIWRYKRFKWRKSHEIPLHPGEPWP